MAITVNIYYSGENGNAKKFAKEMVSSGVVSGIRAKDGNIRYEYFFQWMTRKQCGTVPNYYLGQSHYVRQVLIDMPGNPCIIQTRAEPEKSALPICNYSQILYRFFDFTQNLKRSLLFLRKIHDIVISSSIIKKSSLDITPYVSRNSLFPTTYSAINGNLVLYFLPVSLQ